MDIRRSLRRGPISEGPKMQNRGSLRSGSAVLKDRKRGNVISIAAGAPFSRTKSTDMRPALQREHDFEGPKASD
eukprot:192881-Pyramimonas_sp.AAC.1